MAPETEREKKIAALHFESGLRYMKDRISCGIKNLVFERKRLLSEPMAGPDDWYSKAKSLNVPESMTTDVALALSKAYLSGKDCGIYEHLTSLTADYLSNHATGTERKNG